MEKVRKRYEWMRTQTRRALQLHFIRFVIVGTVGFALSTLLLKLLHGEWGIGIFLATLLACEFGLLWNFISHEKWTYNSVDHRHKTIGRKFVEFHMSSWSGVVILTLLETLAVKVFHFEYLVSFIVAGGITMFWNFFWTKYYIFRGRTPNASAGPKDTVKSEGYVEQIGLAIRHMLREPVGSFDLLVRYLAVGIAGCLIGFVVLVLMAVVFDFRFIIAAGASVVAGTTSVLLCAVALAFPTGMVQFIRRNLYVLLAALCCLLFVGLGTAMILPDRHVTTGNAITYDEIAFLPNGFYHQERGVYYTNPEHPPLVKDIAALPYHALGAKMPPQDLPRDVLLQDYAQYAWGKTFLFESGNRSELIIFAGRFSVLVANAVLLFLLYLSIAKIRSKRTGFIAIFLITMSQFSLAHASVVTVDFMAMAFTMLTLVWFSAWLKSFYDRKPDTLPLVLAALSLSGALVSKFSTVLLVPMLVILTAMYIFMVRKHLEKHWLRVALRLVGLFALAVAVIVVFYSFHVRNMPGDDIVAQLHKSYDTSRLPEVGLSVLETIATQFGILGRAFAEFSHGILMINNRIYNGAGGVYFNGIFYGAEGAGLQYFPLLYLAKLQLGYHLLSIVALVGVVWLGWKNRFRGFFRAIARHPLALVVAAYALVFGSIATLSTLQIGLRHILPAITAFMILTALGADQVIEHFQKQKKNHLWLKGGVTFVASWMVASMLLSFPYYLSYYNLLAGGTNNGYKLAVDSNYDWGQDLKRLAEWQKENGVDMVYVDVFTNPFLPLQHYLGPNSKGFAIHADPLPPPGSYLVVSAHQYQVNTHKDLPSQKQYTQFDDDLVARVGKTIFIYRIPETTRAR